MAGGERNRSDERVSGKEEMKGRKASPVRTQTKARKLEARDDG